MKPVKVSAPFDIAPCTDKDWSKECPHQIDASGWDGGGNMTVEIPITDDELDAAITLLQEYRQKHPRVR